MRRTGSFVFRAFVAVLCAFAAPVFAPVQAAAFVSADRFGFGEFRISPSPFSPAFSPGKKDVAIFRARTDRAVPLLFRIASGDAHILTIPPRETEQLTGNRDRFHWSALSGDGVTPLPSGRYDVDAFYPLTLAYANGSFGEDRRSVIVRPYAVAVDATGCVYSASERSPVSRASLLAPSP